MVEQRKPINWKVTAIFASGLLLGGGVAVWAMLPKDAANKPAAPAAAQVVKASATAAKPAPAPSGAAVHAHVACPAGPVVAAAGREDGHARLAKEADSATEIAALLLGGKEAAAAGRPRDAEILFLAACNAADKLQRADASEPIDARYRLARHYAHLVQVSSTPAANRAELVKRAEVLYSDSVQAYRARFGESHEKTKFAADGLATLRQSVAQVAPAPAAAPVAAAKPPVVAAPAPAPQQPAIVVAPVRQAKGTPTQGRPSFDCALARSPAERRICSDSELSRLDRDLGRLHARARDAAPDSAAFRRQNDREWRRRETSCGGNRECLLDWYAQRRDQLLDDLDE